MISEIKIGDMLIYGNNTRARIVGLPKVNGADGVMVELLDEKPLMASDVFHRASEVEKWVSLGVWRIEESDGRAALYSATPTEAEHE